MATIERKGISVKYPIPGNFYQRIIFFITAYFYCANIEAYIDTSKVCNGRNDCGDDSDESQSAGCAGQKSPPKMHKILCKILSHPGTSIMREVFMSHYL